MNKNDTKDTRKKGFVDPKAIRVFIVRHECELLQFLYEVMAPQSKKNIKHVLTNHQVSVGGAPVSQYNFKLYPEDEVIVSKNRIAKHERKDLPIIYEDDDIIAINKPSGLLSVASDREKGRTAYRLVSDYWTQKNPKGRIFITHRLDEDTSGVLIFSKKAEVRDSYQKVWNEIVRKRGYYAIVEGEMEKAEDRLVDYLVDDETTHLVHRTRNKKFGKEAITNYKVIAYKNGYSLLDINIETGRKNQIRVQLGERGHYVIGDDKYGDPSNPLKRLGLHSYELSLVSPLTGVEHKFVAPMPQQFKDMFFTKKKTEDDVKAKKPRRPRQNDSFEREIPKKKKTQYKKFRKK
ncbi:MAG: RluA family pseudouridine synthase [Bacilli bacterium]|nr:RluA family pseudouridine synthase [Bacilli bacterium]